MNTKILIVLIVLISFGAGLWQGKNFWDMETPIFLAFFILLAYFLALFCFFWKKIHKSKPLLWGTGIGLFLMIICFLVVTAMMRPISGLNYPLHIIIIRTLPAFGLHFLFSLPGILSLGLGPHLFFRGLKEKENKLKKIGLMLSGLLLIPVSLFWLLGVAGSFMMLLYGGGD